MHTAQAATEIRERPSTREGGLDALRTIALARVVLWHAFGLAMLTYLVAAVPAMFFVTGSLLAKSFARRPWREVIADRLRRVLVPLWLFAAVAYAAMAVAWHVQPSARTAVPWSRLWTWLVPLTDPHGSAWEGGYLSSPLWYLRTLVWLLALSPLLRWAWLRFGALAFTVPVSAVFALDVVARHTRIDAAPMLLWQVGDVALYAVFLMLGFAHRDGALAGVQRRGWFVVAGAAAIAAAGWGLTQPVPGHVVNDSHPMHLLVGGAWLALFLGVMPWLDALARSRRAGAVIRWVSRRTMSIYLWHTTAIVVTFEALRRVGALPPGLWSLALLAGTAAGTFSLVLATGWLEDLAARRRAQAWPGAPLPRRRRSLLVAPSVAALGLSSLAMVPMTSSVAVTGGTTTAAATKLRVPSAAPPAPTADPSVVTATPVVTMTAAVATTALDGVTPTLPTTLAPDASSELAARLDAAVRSWSAEVGTAGVQVGVLRPGVATWSTAIGADASGATLAVDGTFDIASVTKSFTAALVLQAADAGLVYLDAPLPRLDAVPEVDLGTTTARQLLAHQSGLVNYRDVPSYATAMGFTLEPDEALRLSAAAPREFAPGTSSAYSSSNYLPLGFLLEQVTGQAYDDLLAERLLEPLGLTATGHLAAGDGEPRFSTGGITSDVSDLLRWTVAYFRDRVALPERQRTVLDAIDPVTAIGTGSIGYCPCTTNLDGSIAFRSIGYAGDGTIVLYSALDDLAVVVHTTESLFDTARFGAVEQLGQTLAGIINTATPDAEGDDG